MPRLVDGAGDGEVVLIQDLQPMWLNQGVRHQAKFSPS